MIQRLQERMNAGARVTGTVDGIAASAASLLSSVCSDLTIAQMGQLMVHEGWGVMQGNKHAFRDAADVLDGIDTSAANVYAGRTGESTEAMLKVMKDETYMNAEQALEAGFVDRIMAVETKAKDDKSAKVMQNRSRRTAALLGALRGN